MRLHHRRIALLQYAAVLIAMTLFTVAPVLAQGPGQGDEPPAPGPIVPSLAGQAPVPDQADMVALVEAVDAENAAWENITFWDGEPLGDERLIPLMLETGIGEQFPTFVTTTLQGNTYELSQTSPATLVNFWASWCGPCRDELPHLLDMHQGGDAPFEVVLLNSWEEEDAYRTFAEAEFPETLISGRAPDELVAEIGLQAIPVSVLLDAEQRVVAVHVGNLTGAVVEFFYALTMTSGEVVQIESPAPDFSALEQAVIEANLQASASTAWIGGMLGLDEPLHLALTPGEKMPAFGLMTRDGDSFQLDLLERPVMLNFWASWCGPCVDEFPLLIEADRADLPFDVVFVNIWDDPYTYEAFLADYSPAITVMIDLDGEIPQQYDFEFVPITVLVDETGVIQFIQRGPMSQAVIGFAAALLQ